MLFQTPALHEPELQVLHQTEEVKSKLNWMLHEPRRWIGSLRRLSFARNIQGSNSIEGFDAGLDDAAAIAVGEEPLDTGSETRLALEGYRNAMTYVLQLAEESDFVYSDQLIKSLHFMMTSYDLKTRPGRWRAGPIYVRNDETGEIVYEGPDVDEVQPLIREFIDDLNAGNGHMPLVAAGMAHLNLVMIHPFRDGNGRIARCLQSLVIARGGTLSPIFMSIEEYLGRNTQSYYDVLAIVSGGSWQPHKDARAWIRFILTAHLRQARTMLRRIRESEELWQRLETLVAGRGVPERSLIAVFDAALGLRVRNATYRAVVDEEISEQSASRDLRQVAEAGLLIPHGEKRGRYYIASPEVRSLRRAIIESRNLRDDSDPFTATTA